MSYGEGDDCLYSKMPAIERLCRPCRSSMTRGMTSAVAASPPAALFARSAPIISGIPDTRDSGLLCHQVLPPPLSSVYFYVKPFIISTTIKRASMIVNSGSILQSYNPATGS